MAKSSTHAIITTLLVAAVIGHVWSRTMGTISQPNTSPHDNKSTLTKEAYETGNELDLDPPQALKRRQGDADEIRLLKEGLLSRGSWIQPLPDFFTFLKTKNIPKRNQRVQPEGNALATTGHAIVRGATPPPFSTVPESEQPGVKKRVTYRFIRIGRSGDGVINPIHPFHEMPIYPAPVNLIPISTMPVNKIPVNRMPITTTGAANVHGATPSSFSTVPKSEQPEVGKRLIHRFVRIGRSGDSVNKAINPFNEMPIYPTPVNKIPLNRTTVNQIKANQISVNQIPVSETTESKNKTRGQLNEMPGQKEETKRQLYETAGQKEKTNEHLQEMAVQKEKTNEQLQETALQKEKTSEQLQETAVQKEKKNQQFPFKLDESKRNKPTEKRKMISSVHQKLMNLVRKRMANVRIGKLPAVLFLRRWNSRYNKLEKPSKSKPQRLLPRYG